MLVRDLGDAYQLVLQPDHGRLSGQLAAAWAEDPVLSAELRKALTLAATRHDDGWAVWERDPRLDDDHRPQGFLGVPRPSMLSSYRACADIVCAENPAAGLLVSMHVSGLQRGRYGLMGGECTPLEDLDPVIREFTVAEEDRQEQLASTLGISEAQRWRAYRRLQFVDVLSLFFGLADLEQGDSRPLDSMTDELRRERDEEMGVGVHLIHGLEQPWTARCEPFPFAVSPTQLHMRRRVVPKRDWPDDESFRVDFAAAPVERVELTLTAEA
jgi:Protein of unknown function (DUF3891)